MLPGASSSWLCPGAFPEFPGPSSSLSSSSLLCPGALPEFPGPSSSLSSSSSCPGAFPGLPGVSSSPSSPCWSSSSSSLYPGSLRSCPACRRRGPACCPSCRECRPSPSRRRSCPRRSSPRPRSTRRHHRRTRNRHRSPSRRSRRRSRFRTGRRSQSRSLPDLRRRHPAQPEDPEDRAGSPTSLPSTAPSSSAGASDEPPSSSSSELPGPEGLPDPDPPEPGPVWDTRAAGVALAARSRGATGRVVVDGIVGVRCVRRRVAPVGYPGLAIAGCRLPAASASGRGRGPRTRTRKSQRTAHRMA